MALVDPISKAQIPGKLFRYVAIDNWTLNFLENQELYLPAPVFNDPFDCNIPVQIDLLVSNQEEFEAYVSKHNKEFEQAPPEIKEAVRKEWLTKEFREEYELFQQNKFKEDFGVLCLTSSPDNLLMWSHYGKSHTGLCVGLDISILVELEVFSTFGPVHYTNIYPNISPQEYDLNGVYKQLFYKSLDWSYENEYRVVLRGGAGKTIPFPTEMITEIFMGTSISKTNKNLIKELRNNKFPTAKLIQMELGKGEFKLVQSVED